MKSFLLQATLLVFSSSLLGLAETARTPVDTEKEAEKLRKNYVDRFIKFTQDRNVSGKAKDLSGNLASGGEKSRFNKDDGNSFESDLTYHDASFFTDDPSAQNSKNDPNAPPSRIHPFVSGHGGISAGGGSSQLERTAYEKHKEFSKDGAPEPPPQKGIQYFSIFKKETIELKNKSTSNGQSSNQQPSSSPNEVEEVSRITMRPEAKQAIEQVGEEASKSVEKVAKDPDAGDDPQRMGNSALYREAISRASKAMWDSTLANLVQRRVRKSSDAELYEAVSDCNGWAQMKTQEIENDKDLSAALKEDRKKQIPEELKKCQQMSQIKWNTIQPKFESDGKGGQAQLKEKGIKNEDPYERDLRNQLEVMDKVGIESGQLQSQWQYSQDLFKNEVLTETDESGNVSTAPMTNKEQLEGYNQALDEALEGLKQAQQVLPDLKFDEEAIQARKIEPGKKNILEINQVPEHVLQQMGADTNSSGSTGQGASTTYTELNQQQNSQ